MSEKNKLIIAAAGSGKTTYIINRAMENKAESILITTYTIANSLEIKKSIIEKIGYIPSNIVIQTWFAFLLQHGVKPFQDCLTSKKIKGMQLVNSPSATVNGRSLFNEKDVDNYYFNKEYKIYSDKIAKFCFMCNENTNGYVIDRISRIYSQIFVDEVQDLAGYDLEILKLLMNSTSKVTLVGDPRQVTYLTNNAKKNSKYKDGRIEDFIIDKCKKCNCIIDKKSLNKSYRNNEFICEYSSRLYPNFETCESKQNEKTNHDGIFLIKREDISKYLIRYNPMQLIWNSKTKINENYNFMNMGESKGLTFDRVLIYPTKTMEKWILDNSYNLENTTKSKFYVALTRAKYSVGIVLDYNENFKADGIINFYKS